MKTPVRTCGGCGEMRPKGEMIRVGAVPTWRVTTGAVKLPGRGAYVCPRADCIERARERGSLERALRHGVPGEVYGELALLAKESK